MIQELVDTKDNKWGHLITQTDQYGTTVKKYDKYGRIEEIKLPTATTWSEKYYYYLDDAGNTYIEKRVNDGSPDGLWSRQYMNLLGKVYRKEYKAYSKEGGSVAMREDVGYDIHGRVVSTTKPYIEGNPVYTTYLKYDDPKGRLTQKIYPDGFSYAVGFQSVFQRMVGKCLARYQAGF